MLVQAPGLVEKCGSHAAVVVETRVTMNTYLLIKIVHMSCAMLSAAGFALRGYWMVAESSLLQSKPARILPHIVDTLLLLSAILLVVMSGQYPFVVAWVTIKIVLLVMYIVLGTLALKRGKTKQQRIAFLIASLLTIAAIFVVAALKPGW
jgi:uncharacterized membrane protein SirB2